MGIINATSYKILDIPEDKWKEICALVKKYEKGHYKGNHQEFLGTLPCKISRKTLIEGFEYDYSLIVAPDEHSSTGYKIGVLSRGDTADPKGQKIILGKGRFGQVKVLQWQKDNLTEAIKIELLINTGDCQENCVNSHK